MKNWFILSIAVFAFLISCGKKEKKQGQIGKAVEGSGLQCDGKDKGKNEACKKAEENKTPNGEPNTEKTSAQQNPGKPTPTDVLSTYPNIPENSTMSLHLQEDKAMAAELSIDSRKDTTNLVKVQVGCSDLRSLKDKDVFNNLLNPDDLKNIELKLLLTNNSQIHSTMRFKNSDSLLSKPFLISCSSKVEASNYEAEAGIIKKELKEGVSTVDIIENNADKDNGIMASFQCLSDEKILSEPNKVSSDNLVLNKVKLTKGSSVLFVRGLSLKDNDQVKKIPNADSKLTNDKIVLIKCI